MGLSDLRAGVAGALAALGLMATAPTAHADWLRAESERFIVYSDGSERALREYVQKLETFDRVLRFRTSLPIGDAPPRKLPIYLVSNRRGLTQVHPSTAQHVVGTYFPTEEDIFAVAIRSGTGVGLDGDAVLLHEYVHHFMLGMPAAYPSWFVEGFAEYYATAKIKDDDVLLGSASANRAYWLLNESWIPLETLLRSNPSEVRSNQRSTYYPVAWLLTHWFMSDEARRRQLQAYLTAVGEGEDPVQAMEDATGMGLADLRTALRSYTRTRLTGTRVVGHFPATEVTVVRLPKSANDLLLINQRLKVGVPKDDREALGQEVARIAAEYGDDPLALIAAGHAGMHFGDRPAGERALLRLIELQPDHVEALRFLAQEKLRQAREAEDPAVEIGLKREARAYLARAYAAGDNDYQTLMLMTDLRRDQPDYPSDNDMLAMGLTLDRAPQLASVRFGYAAALSRRNETEQAIAILRPLTNDPHGGAASEFAERMVAALEAGQALPETKEDAEAPQISESEPEEPETSPADTPETAPASADK
ncbi:MAG: hypothetical protein KYX67_09945 [Brevundimonas sp.]|uniref:hypothetical protein n=1 Tax=Brevundimonas sp. TaxID=1871086 RepID=UPI00256239B7|nr:hypothetical protein [Brevundimonas sp.]MDK2747630.1 hypothetical protein [Brevundimonas sp.]